MSEPTTELVDKQIDQFIDHFEAFDARLVARANPDVYLPLSDKIALFATYWNQED
jgi:hypothetical protein